VSATVRELTARGRGGVSVLEVRGDDARARVGALLEGERPPTPGDLRVVRLTSAGELLDEALLWVLASDRLELHVHGSPPLVDRVRAELGGPGPGTPQGDTLEERAGARLAEAASEAAARVLLDQVEGALRAAALQLHALLTSGDDAGARERARDLALAGERCRALLEPPLVVLAGPVNAGKSTLFNVVVGRERVVVDAAHGTTRDAVRERVQLGAYAVDLVDTAGEREAGEGRAAAVERGGQEVARALRASADAVLWLSPPGGDDEVPVDPPAGWVVLAGRADERIAGAPVPGRALSATAAPEDARAAVVEALHAALALAREPWVPGAAVPFEWEQRALLEELAGAARPASSAEARKRLETLFLH
jgi:tRNA modification GTPase